MMGGNQPNDHDLNRMLAEVCGIKLNNMDTWWQLQHSTHGMEWNPLHDANQMERAEEAVRKMDVHIVYVWDGENHHWDLMPQTQFSKIH